MSQSCHSANIQEVEMDRKIMRGEIYYADLSPVIGSEQGGMRPVLVLQNNVGNKHSPTVIVAVITSRLGKPKLPTHVKLGASYLAKDSMVLLEQIRTIDKRRLLEYVGRVTLDEMSAIERALLVSVGIDAKNEAEER